MNRTVVVNGRNVTVGGGKITIEGKNMTYDIIKANPDIAGIGVNFSKTPCSH